MSEYIHLIGASDVQSAGYVMRDAASDMQRAANTIEDCTTRLERLFGQGYGTNLDRLIEALEKQNEINERANPT